MEFLGTTGGLASFVTGELSWARSLGGERGGEGVRWWGNGQLGGWGCGVYENGGWVHVG